MDFNTYKAHITRLGERINMPQQHTAEVLRLCAAICADSDFSDAYQKIEDRFFAGDDSTRDDIARLAEEHGMEKYMATLTFCEMYSLRTLEIYGWRNYDTDVYYDSFRDLVIWGNVCLKQHGTFGIANYGWVSEQIRAAMFRIGRLQFHLIPHHAPDYTHAGVRVQHGDEVINIHIPEGDSLTREKRLDSYRRAYRFFHQTGNAVFVCDSWLLYPAHTEFLDERSNILDFMRDFEIIHFSEKHGSFDDCWRVFGFRESYDPDSLPRETGLQRSYADRLASGGATGSGYGVFIFDGKNII